MVLKVSGISVHHRVEGFRAATIHITAIQEAESSWKWPSALSIEMDEWIDG